MARYGNAGGRGRRITDFDDQPLSDGLISKAGPPSMEAWEATMARAAKGGQKIRAELAAVPSQRSRSSHPSVPTLSEHVGRKKAPLKRSTLWQGQGPEHANSFGTHEWRASSVGKKDDRARNTAIGAGAGAVAGHEVNLARAAHEGHRYLKEALGENAPSRGKVYGEVLRSGHTPKIKGLYLGASHMPGAKRTVGALAATGAQIGYATGHKKSVKKAFDPHGGHFARAVTNPRFLPKKKPVLRGSTKENPSTFLNYATGHRPTTYREWGQGGVEKAARYYDPEHRRQRRLGMAEAGLLGGGLVAGGLGAKGAISSTRAARSITGVTGKDATKVARARRGLKHGILASPKDLGLLAGGAVGVGGAGVVRQKAEGRKFGIWR